MWREKPKEMFKKLKAWYGRQTPTTKAFLWIGLVCIVGIIIRWKAVVAGITKGFQFYAQ